MHLGGTRGQIVQIFWGRIEGREIPLKIVRKIKKDFHDLSFDLEMRSLLELKKKVENQDTAF